MNKFGSSSPTTAIVTYGSLIFLFAPLLVVVVFSFHAIPSLSLPFQGFSLRWYEQVFASREFRAATQTSLKVSTFTTLLTVISGTMAAYGLSKMGKSAQSRLSIFFLLPLALPGLFLGLALLVFFASTGFPLSLYTVVIGHLVFVFPYYLLIAKGALDRLDPALEDAASDLGATPLLIFWKVTMPQILPVLSGAACLVFALSFDEFVITFFVIGSDSTLPMLIWSGIRRTIDPSINTVSSLLLIVTIALFSIAFFLALRRVNHSRI